MSQAAVASPPVEAVALVREYLLLGLRLDRLIPGLVDAFTGDPELRRRTELEPRPDPSRLAAAAGELRAALPDVALAAPRSRFIDAQLRALECGARRLAGQEIGFVDEVAAYFDVRIAPGEPDRYRAAHRAIAAELPGDGPLVARMNAMRVLDEVPAERLPVIVRALSGALRQRVGESFALAEGERVGYEIVGDRPWAGLHRYLGGLHSTVAINTDVPHRMGGLAQLVAHESYPGHHTQHCRTEAGAVAAGHGERTLSLINTPQCLMAEGAADLGLLALVGPDWGGWAQQVYADLGLALDGARAQRLEAAAAELSGVRQDAALMLHDRGADPDDVAAYLQRWLLVPAPRARQMLRFLADPRWRTYTTTYVEGYRLLRRWLDARPHGESTRARYRRLLDEPLTPGSIRDELAG